MPLTSGITPRIIPTIMKKSQKWADVARWLGYVRRSPRELVAAFLCLAVVMAADVVTPKIFGFIIDSVISPPALSAGAVRLPVIGLLPVTTALLCILGFLLSIIALRGFAGFGTSVILGEVGEHVHLDIRQELFDHLQKLPLAWYDVSYTGKIMARVTTDTDALWALLSNGVRSVIGPALTIIVVVIILFTISVPLTLVALVTAPLSGLLYRTARLRVTDATRNQRETLSSLYARLQERISGVRTIRIFAREKEESRLFGADIRALYSKNVTLIRSWSRFGMRAWWITAAANACILCIGGIVVARGGFSIGNLVSFSLYAGMLFGPLGQLVDSYAQLMTNGEVAMRRIFEVLDEPIAGEVSSGSEPCPQVQGGIRLESVSFSYVPESPVLRDVSIEIRPGERAAIVGPSGGGKSTLVNLICRFYSLSSGRILVDGADITRWDVKSWRRRISYVAQDSFIFSGTIRDNIRFGKPEASDDEVERAAAHANALDTIRAMPQGFDTVAGERGITLSGGQRQRIAIARALVLDPSLIIMDEPTSALDAESESILLEALDSVFKGRTCIVIAHRLSTVVNSDTIFVLSDGRIVQQGRHAELLAVPGIYHELCTRQFLLGGTRL